MSSDNNEEKIILKHDPIPPYKTVFYIVFVIGVIYLISIIILGVR